MCLLCTVQAKQECIDEEASMLQMQPKTNQALQPNLDPAVKDYDAPAPAPAPVDDSQGDITTEDYDDGEDEIDDDELVEGREDGTAEDDDDLWNSLHHQDENDEDEHKLLKDAQAQAGAPKGWKPFDSHCNASRRRCCVRTSGRRRKDKCKPDWCAHNRRRRVCDP